MADDKDKGAPKPKVSEQADLKVTARTPKTTYEPLRTSVPKQDVIGRSLYWFGALPASGEFEWKVPTKEYNEDTDDYYRVVRTTSEKLWFPRDKRHPRIWRGKCSSYKGLTVSGLQFPAFTETIIDRGEGEETKLTWPGAIKAMTEQEIQKILTETTRWVIRANGKLVNLGIADRRGEALDVNNANTVTITPPVHAEHGDVPVAEYVYLVKLSAPATTPRRDFWKIVPEMSDFFKNPPPALAQPVEASA